MDTRKLVNTNKQELKYLYKAHKISAIEYFSKLSEIIKNEVPKNLQKSDVLNPNTTQNDILNIFDGKLPLYAITGDN